MKLRELALRGGVDSSALEEWLRSSGAHKQWVKDGFMGMTIADNADVNLIISDFKAAEAEKAARAAKAEAEKAARAAKEAQDKADAQMRAEEAARKKQQALASMLISSGFSFDGYKIVKYSGYISGDDVIQIKKERSFWTGLSKTDVGNALSESLVKIRRQAIAELKEAAYELGCNAVVGVDFDYITLDPQIHNGQITQDLPYVFCVTANGNAVVIEKE